jgi:hypothetical protein
MSGRRPPVIPTVILWGAVFGRWWKATLVGSAIAWPTVLVVDGAMGLEMALRVAAALAVANAAVGAAVHQGVLWLVRRLRQVPRGCTGAKFGSQV